MCLCLTRSNHSKDTHEDAQWRNVFNVQFVTFSFLRLTVGKNVPLQITSLAKCFVALTTFVQFLSGVSEEMPLHIGSRWKWFVALSTFVRPLSTMGSLVLSQVASFSKRLVALTTFMQLINFIEEPTNEIPESHLKQKISYFRRKFVCSRRWVFSVPTQVMSLWLAKMLAQSAGTSKPATVNSENTARNAMKRLSVHQCIALWKLAQRGIPSPASSMPSTSFASLETLVVTSTLILETCWSSSKP